MYYLVKKGEEYLHARSLTGTTVWAPRELGMRYERDEAIALAIRLDGVAEPFIVRKRKAEGRTRRQKNET